MWVEHLLTQKAPLTGNKQGDVDTDKQQLPIRNAVEKKKTGFPAAILRNSVRILAVTKRSKQTWIRPENRL